MGESKSWATATQFLLAVNGRADVHCNDARKFKLGYIPAEGFMN